MDTLHKIKLTCKETILLSSMNEESGVSLFSRVRLFIHCFSCPLCRRFIEQFKIITKGMNAYPPADLAKQVSPLTPEKKQSIQEEINKIS